MASATGRGEVEVRVPITDRARRFGYLFWPASEDVAVERLLGDSTHVEVEFCGEPLGRKRVDRKHRRISVGTRQTARLPDDAREFRLRLGGGRLSVAAE